MKKSKTQTRAKTRMLRLDSDLWEQIGKQASGGKTPRQEIERRLRESLMETTGDRMSPARALSRLIELLAEEVFAFTQPPKAGLEEIDAGTTVLVNELLAGYHDPNFVGQRRIERDEYPLADSFGRFLALMVIRAHLPRKQTNEDSRAREGVPPGSLVQTHTGFIRRDELVGIQKALGLPSEPLDKTAES